MARHALLALLCLALLTAPSQSEAKGTADEAEVQFQLGNEAFHHKRYRPALAHFFASNKLVVNRNVLVNIALCYQGLKAHVEAYRYFTDALKLTEPGVERAAIEKERARAQEHVALVKIDSVPQGAMIYLGREDLGALGVTPLTLPLAPNVGAKAYKILVRAPDHALWTMEVKDLKQGHKETILATPRRLYGTLKVTTSVEGFRLVVDGKDRGEVKGLSLETKAAAGSHEIEVRAVGFLPVRRTTRINHNAVTLEEVTLIEATGTVVVDVDETDAAISIDGTVVGFTPSVLDAVSVGEHELMISKDGFRPFKTRIEVLSNQHIRVEGILDVEDGVRGASGVTESILAAPASVSLITAREIRAFGNTTLADALKGTRGMYMTSDHIYQSPGIRGYAPFGQYGNRVQILIDGHRINDDWLGSSYIGYDLLPSLHEVERIEVIRGPGSALYGTGAFFGVVNLVTPRKVAEMKTTVGISMAEDGGIRSHATFAAPMGKTGGVRLYAGVLYRQPGEYFSPTFDKTAKGVGEEVASGFLLKAWLGDFTLQAHGNDRTQQIPTGAFETIFGDERTETQDDRFFVELRYEPKLSNELSLSSKLTYDLSRYSGAYPYEDEDGGLLTERFRGQAVGGGLRTDYAPLNWAKFTLGTDYQFHFQNLAKGKDNEGTLLDESHPYHSAAAYGIAHLELFPWWSISAGVRFDASYVTALPGLVGPEGEDVKDIWQGRVPDKIVKASCPGAGEQKGEKILEDGLFSSINPRLAMFFRPGESSTIKAMVGRAFRAASIYERTYNDGCLTQAPSPGLTEESVWTADLEFIQKLPASVWVTLSSSLSLIDNGIGQVSQTMSINGQEEDILYYTHAIEPAQALGVEAEVRKEFRRGWMMVGHYGYQVTKIRASSFMRGQDARNAPNHMAGFKVIVPLLGRHARLASRVVVEVGRRNRDGEKVGAAVLWDLSVSGEVPSIRMQYTAGIRNILDWSYYHPVGDEHADLQIRQPGTSAVVDLTFQF